MGKFIHLHTHSHYSLLNALPKVPELIEAAKESGMQALALTDNGNLYGAIEFYKECKAAKIKPIIGVDAYVAVRTRSDKQAGVDNRRTRLVLLAENEEGYKNLMRLVTASHLEGFYYKPRIDKEVLEKHHKGLVCINPSFSGDIALAVKAGDMQKASEWADFYLKLFGKDRFYIEITRHPEIQGHNEAMKKLVAFAREKKISIVAAHDVYYIDPADRLARETVVSIQNNMEIIERRDFDGQVDDFSFITEKDALKRFKDIPDALENSVKIANMCNVEIELGKWVFPHIETPIGKNFDEAFRDIVYAGFEKRSVEKTSEILTRVEYELGVIAKKGYSPYFLIVADLLAYARSHGILSNIRGSVSGSMVTYLSGITNINPLEYEIPFERFLNPDRPSAPDIDMDFADNRRDEMVEYARHKYGYDKVAQIGTFGTMMARGSVRDTARALGFPYALGDKIAKLIPLGSQGFPMTIEKALEMEPELKKLYKDDADTKRIIDMAKKIEGNARHISIHAAGVVIAPTELTDFTPLQFDPKGENKIITQYDMYSVEDAGLLKFDFLGLKNLSIIADAVRLVEKIRNVKIDIDNLPIDDKRTFEMLARGETADLFQLNGDGMTHFLIELKPSTIHDINAMVALYRPGPIQFIPEYIARKHDHSRIKYLDPALEEILKKTYGILVYQDDLLMMANRLAGYSWGEVDKFRKAVGKKIPKEMAEQKEKFIKGCVEYSGWSEKKAEEVWRWIEPFAAYGFNKAHSVSYGRVAYITAYLKANFPGEYMTAVLTAELGDIEKVAESIAECKRMKINVLPPDINQSFHEFTLLKDKNGKDVIRFGLGSIKNFGEGIGKSIIEERNKGGSFTSLGSFLTRVKDKNLNKKSLEALIKSGALDALGERGQMLTNIDHLLQYHKEKGKSGGSQDSLFGALPESQAGDLRLGECAPASIEEKLVWEKELLGLFISGHPLDKHKAKLEKQDMNIKEVKEGLRPGMVAVAYGILEDVRPILTKGGDKMVFLKIADFSGSIEAVVFPKVYKDYEQILQLDNCVGLKGRLSNRNNSTSIIVERVKQL